MTYALITGASKGIGKAIATELARRQFNVLLLARSGDQLRQLADELRQTYGVQADYLAVDLSAGDAAQRVFDWCQTRNYVVQTLVNNAGYGLSGPFETYSIAEHENMMAVNMTALMQLCRLFLPILRQQPKAYILNVASSAAYQAVPGLSLYAATKAFVLTFSRGLHQELRKTSVSVTAVSPGSTDTEFAARARVGEKALKAAEKINMTPGAVAKIAVDSMLAGKIEVITGVVNKLGAFAAWLLPKGLVERTAGKIYE
ncbi:MAG: SDR family oxidoreductase [Bacteroidetes bacterium]|nr:SDR family oxidoreductase [Fibrella sp.]